MPISIYSWATKHLVNGMRIQLVNYLSENHPASFLLMTSSSSNFCFSTLSSVLKWRLTRHLWGSSQKIQWRIIDLRIFEDVSVIPTVLGFSCSYEHVTIVAWNAHPQMHMLSQKVTTVSIAGSCTWFPSSNSYSKTDMIWIQAHVWMLEPQHESYFMRSAMGNRYKSSRQKMDNIQYTHQEKENFSWAVHTKALLPGPWQPWQPWRPCSPRIGVRASEPKTCQPGSNIPSLDPSWMWASRVGKLVGNHCCNTWKFWISNKKRGLQLQSTHRRSPGLLSWDGWCSYLRLIWKS